MWSVKRGYMSYVIRPCDYHRQYARFFFLVISSSLDGQHQSTYCIHLIFCYRTNSIRTNHVIFDKKNTNTMFTISNMSYSYYIIVHIYIYIFVETYESFLITWNYRTKLLQYTELGGKNKFLSKQSSLQI